MLHSWATIWSLTNSFFFANPELIKQSISGRAPWQIKILLNDFSVSSINFTCTLSLTILKDLTGINSLYFLFFSNFFGLIGKKGTNSLKVLNYVLNTKDRKFNPGGWKTKSGKMWTCTYGLEHLVENERFTDHYDSLKPYSTAKVFSLDKLESRFEPEYTN